MRGSHTAHTDAHTYRERGPLPASVLSGRSRAYDVAKEDRYFVEAFRLHCRERWAGAEQAGASRSSEHGAEPHAAELLAALAGLTFILSKR